MKIWDDITTTALMGVERQSLKLPDGDGDDLSATLRRLDRSDQAAALLSAAAAAAVYRRAGRLPNAASTPLPPPAAADTILECPAAAVDLLALIFAGEYRQLAAEAFELLAASQRRLPASLLPAALDLGRQQTDLREPIAAVLGERGRWLAGHNPEWSWALKAAGPAEWALAPRPARIAALLELGSRDPAEARRLLQSTWTEESADDRAALLATRAAGLSIDDEDLLESALDDRSISVRRVAADLLARLPESRYVRRMIERLTPLITRSYQFIGGHRLEVKLPEACDAALSRDIDSAGPSASKAAAKGSGAPAPPAEGERSGWLRQMLAAVPPRHWESALELTPDEIVRLAEKTEWHDTLIRGLAQAAGRYPADEAWTISLLQSAKRPLAVAGSAGWPELTPAIEALPPTRLEALITAEIERAPIAAPGPVQWLLPLHRRPWSREFALTMIGSMRRTFEDYSDNQTLYTVAAMLQNMVLRMPPDLADEFATIWTGENDPADSAVGRRTTYWSNLSQQLDSLLHFRQDLRQAITEQTSP